MPGPKAGFEEGQCSQRWHSSVQKVYYIIITIYQEARQLERVGKPDARIRASSRAQKGVSTKIGTEWAQPSDLMMGGSRG